MILLGDNTACRMALSAFTRSYGAAIPATMHTQYDQISADGSSVNCIANMGELLYAAIPSITDAPSKAAAQTLCGQLADYAGNMGWITLGNGRGIAMRIAMQRDLGEPAPTGGAWPDASTDPKPMAVYTATTVVIS